MDCHCDVMACLGFTNKGGGHHHNEKDALYGLHKGESGRMSL